MADTGLLSVKAVEWLKSVHYSEKPHDQRMTLIKAAIIAYPNVKEKKHA